MSLNPNVPPFMPASRYVSKNPQKMPDGTVRFWLQTDSWLEVAPSRAIKLWNVNLRISVAISHDGRAVALSHPNCFLQQDGSTKLSAFDKTGLLGHVYSNDDRIIMSHFHNYCIWESGRCEPLGRNMYPDELLDAGRDFVGALFARETCAEAGALPTSPLRHLTFHNCFGKYGTIERCHVYGVDILQEVTGFVTVRSPQGGVKMKFSPKLGLTEVMTPTLLFRGRSDLQSVYVQLDKLEMFLKKKKLCAKSTMFMAGINAHSFFCRELNRPITYMHTF